LQFDDLTKLRNGLIEMALLLRFDAGLRVLDDFRRERLCQQEKRE
jgi:hypothetical protein